MRRLIILAFMPTLLMAVQPLWANTTETVELYTSQQCTDCHNDMVEDHTLSVHRAIECLTCHTEAAQPDHKELPSVNCRQCHPAHDAKVIHDPHTRVTCSACHLKGGVPTLDRESGNVVWSGAFRPGSACRPHQMVRNKTDALCRNCHFQGNSLGACSMILPPKSILCMPCHMATLSLQDGISIAALMVFLLGMGGMCVIWFSGITSADTRRSEEEIGPEIRSKTSDTSNGRLSRLFLALIWEVLLQQRLYRLSPARWTIHALIFFPILVRFSFGLTALFLSLYLPDRFITTEMLDKNQPVVAFLSDLTGLMIIAGTAAAIIRKIGRRDAEIASLPETGWGLSALLGLTVLTGFVLEGVRIAMTGWTSHTGYAFVGYRISLLLEGVPGVTDSYGYAWYVHAILVGVLVALVPFTRLSHVITAPLVLIMNARHTANE